MPFISLPRSSCLYALAMLSLSANTAWALPEGGTVAAGTADIVTDPNSVTVNQSSNKAVIDWTSFDTSAGQSVNFNQPDPSSVTLNRISGPATQFDGNMNANGQVWLINQNGMVFGSNARVNVAGLLVSTANISNANFMEENLNGAYDYVFDEAGNPQAAIVVRNGARIITAPTLGYVTFMAPGIVQEGGSTVRALEGHITYAAGETFTAHAIQNNLVDFYSIEDVTIGNPVTTAAIVDGVPVTSPIQIQSGAFLWAAFSPQYPLSNGTVTFRAKVTQSAFNNFFDANGDGSTNHADTPGLGYFYETSDLIHIDPHANIRSAHQRVRRPIDLNGIISAYEHDIGDLLPHQQPLFPNVGPLSPLAQSGISSQDATSTHPLSNVLVRRVYPRPSLVPLANPNDLQFVFPPVEHRNPNFRFFEQIVADPVVPPAPPAAAPVINQQQVGQNFDPLGRPLISLADSVNANNFPETRPGFVNFGGAAGELSLLGAGAGGNVTIANAGNLSPEALGELAPAAGGGASQNGESEDNCANEYLDTPFADEHVRCGGAAEQI